MALVLNKYTARLKQAFPKTKESNILILFNYRFYFTSLVLLVLLIFHTKNGNWVGDFWEHSGVVRELAANPFSPQHPQLLLDAPHVFYSPYALVVAIISRLTGIDVIGALSVAGIFNLLFFLLSLKLFVSLLFPEQAEGVSFYTLLFTLLLWGREMTPWDWSGFFHLKTLGYVIPYPSTFTIALVFSTLSMNILLLRNRNRFWYLPILIFSIIVLLSHPLSFIVLSVGLLVTSLGIGLRPLYDFLTALFLLLSVLLLALFWPYYPVVNLLLGESSIFHAVHKILYQSVLDRILPSVLGFPFFLWLFKSHMRHPLMWIFITLSGIYIYGMVSEQWAYGRVISVIVLTLHISLAAAIARLESKPWRKGNQVGIQKPLLTFIVLLLLVPFSYKSLIKPVLERSSPGIQNTYSQYEWLPGYVGQYEVVLSDMVNNTMVPTFGGKVVAVSHILPYVPDIQERIDNVNRFFHTQLPLIERLAIVEKYDVSYLLLDKGKILNWKEFLQPFATLGVKVFENEQFILISISCTNLKVSETVRLDSNPEQLACGDR
jgi:hypothetical protein